MNIKEREAIEAAFGRIKKIEAIRTNILFVPPYGDISIPDISLPMGLDWYVARVPDEKFFKDCYWASYGPRPSDDDSDVFVVPILTKPWMTCMLSTWVQIRSGNFILTDSGVIVLDANSIFAWEGYSRPETRAYKFDRTRLEKSVVALKMNVKSNKNK